MNFGNLIQRIKKSLKPRVVVLMYHRIAIVETDPWQLSVSPANFEQQLQVLKAGYNVIGIRELKEQLLAKKVSQNSVCITFDDAYSDNYHNARPLLEKYKLPATFFIPSDYIGNKKQFWWDELEAVLLHTQRLPASLTITINRQLVEYQLQNTELTAGERKKQQSWVWPDAPPTDRCKLYLKLWELLRPLPGDEIKDTVASITQWATGNYRPAVESLPMTVAQLTELNANPVFTFGVHTKTHPDLAAQPEEKQREEIAGCKTYLEHNFFHRVNAIAYPYGRYNDLTVSVAGKLQMLLGFTTNESPVRSDSVPLCLGRFQVVNSTGDDFKNQLQQWFKSSS